MCDEWMKQLELPMTIEQFHQLPRCPAYKYEYLDGSAWLSPRPRFFHGLLDLGTLEKEPLEGKGPQLTLRGVRAEDWETLPKLFAAAFRGRQPFGSLDDAEMMAASGQCLQRTRTGGDGPWIEQASYLAFLAEVDWPIGAILLTLLPDEDPADWDSFSWPEPPPADCLERRLGRPHITWIFVHPYFMFTGAGTTLLHTAGRTLLGMGYRTLASTFLLGNDSSMLWHWRNGFRLAAHPGSRRRPR